MIILRVICQQPCVGIILLDHKHSQITRNQKGNQVRTKTSGANSIKSKSVNTWNDLNKLFINPCGAAPGIFLDRRNLLSDQSRNIPGLYIPLDF